MPLLNNFSANMPGFNGPSQFSSQVGVDPQQGGPPVMGGRLPWNFGGAAQEDQQQQQQQPPMAAPLPPPPPQQQQPMQMPMPPPAPMMPQQQAPQSNPMTAAMNQALMHQLATGGTGMQQPSPLVSANAQQVGGSPRNFTPLFGA